MIVAVSYPGSFLRFATAILVAGTILGALADAPNSFGQALGDATTKVVEVSGAGVDVESAKKDACREAVRQVVGSYVASKTRTENDDLIEDKVISLSAGFVEKIEALKESSTDGLVRVRIRATVKITKLLDKLKENNIAVSAVDGLSLGAQLQTLKDQMKGQAGIIEAAIEDCPAKWFTASIVGEPTLGEKIDGSTVPVLVTVKIEPDLDAYLASAEKLDKALEAANLGSGEFQCDAAVCSVNVPSPHKVENVEPRQQDFRVIALSCLDLERVLSPTERIKETFNSPDSPVCYMFPVKFMGKGRRSTWKSYAIKRDTEAHKLLGRLAHRGLPWRVTLSDEEDEEIAIQTGLLARYDENCFENSGLGRSVRLSCFWGGVVVAPALILDDGRLMAPMFTFSVAFQLDEDEVNTVRKASVALR